MITTRDKGICGPNSDILDGSDGVTGTGEVFISVKGDLIPVVLLRASADESINEISARMAAEQQRLDYSIVIAVRGRLGSPDLANQLRSIASKVERGAS